MIPAFDILPFSPRIEKINLEKKKQIHLRIKSLTNDKKLGCWGNKRKRKQRNLKLLPTQITKGNDPFIHRTSASNINFYRIKGE